MKVRLKFSKVSDLKYIGHLDLMRFFQKTIRRSGLPIKFSEGMSPHMIMSFASPLGLGLTSEGEYVDLEFTEDIPTALIVERLNACVIDGLKILGAVQIGEGRADNAMALIAGADYRVVFREGFAPEMDWKGALSGFLAQESIEVMKESKKGQRLVDIRPLILEVKELTGEEGVFMKLTAGSAANLKPELVMEAFAAYAGFALPEFALHIHRLEMYAQNPAGEGLVSLLSLGKPFPEVDA